MPAVSARRLYLPPRDRSYWRAPARWEGELDYLAWGHRDFARQPVPASQHDGWVLALIERGSPTVELAGRRQVLRAGSLLVVRPDCEFGWPPVAPGFCKFRVWLWRDLVLPPLPSAEGWLLRSLPQAKRRPFVRAHDECREELMSPDAHTPRFLAGARLRLEVLLARSLSANVKTDDAELTCERAEAWMRAHLDSAEPVARLGDYLNLSQSSLHRLFMRRFGVSPMARIHELRMEHAKVRLRDARTQVKSVALELGYRHGNDFSRAFRRAVGTSPKAFRGGATPA